MHPEVHRTKEDNAAAVQLLGIACDEGMAACRKLGSYSSFARLLF